MKKLFFILLFMFVCSSAFAVNYCDDPNARVCLNFLDNSSPTTDDSGNGFNGVLSGSIVWNAGLYYDFDGSNDYIYNNDGIGISTTDESTIVVRFKAVSTGTNKYISAFRDAYGDRGHLMFDGSAKMYFKRVGSDATGTTVIQTGTWYNVCIPYDITSGVPTIYLDGSDDTASTTADTTPEDWTKYAVGARWGALFFEGAVDYFAIFDREFSEAECQDINTNGLTGATSTFTPYVMIF